MKAVTICGSMKFAEEMKQVAFELESKKGYTVLQCVYNDLKKEITPEMFENLKQAHFKKIEMCDIIFVMDVNGYVGDSVKQEIEYAKTHNKEIIFYSQNNL